MRIALFCACLLLPGVALSAEWVADPASSKLEFTGSQSGQKFRGRFEKFAGRISFDPARPEAGSADVTIELASATTGDRERDGAIPAPEWFDVKKFPQATFHAASFTAKGGDAYEATGKLTIRGVGADVVLPFTLQIDGDTAHAAGHVDLLRTTFGIGQGPWASDQIVAFQVVVEVALVARKAP